MSALQKTPSPLQSTGAAIIHLGVRIRAGFEAKELVAFEPQVAHPGKRVRFRSPEIDAGGAMTLAETLALR